MRRRPQLSTRTDTLLPYTPLFRYKDTLAFRLQPLVDPPVEKRRIGEPAAAIGLEQVAHDAATGFDIGAQTDEACPFVGGAHAVLGPFLANIGRRFVEALFELIPQLFLAPQVVRPVDPPPLLHGHRITVIEGRPLRRDSPE